MRLNVYVPDDLAVAAREAGLNVSRLTQDAIVEALARRATDHWLAGLPSGRARVSHDRAVAALDDARDEFGG